MYLLFLYVANFVRTREEVLFVVSFLLIGCLIESVVVVALAFSDWPSGLWGRSIFASMLNRTEGGRESEELSDRRTKPEPT